MDNTDNQCDQRMKEGNLFSCRVDSYQEECQTSVLSKTNQEGCGVPEVGMEFETENHAYAFYNRYAGSEGFSIRDEWIGRRKNGVTKSRRYVCSREGFSRKRKHEDEKGTLESCTERPRKIRKKCGCMAAMEISLQHNGKYCVSVFEAKHNHACSTPTENHMLKSQRKITPQVDLLGAANDSGIQPAFECMGKENGGHNHHTSSSTDTSLPSMASQNPNQMFTPSLAARCYDDSVITNVVLAPKDPILGFVFFSTVDPCVMASMAVAYNKDPSPTKLNSCVGSHQTEGKNGLSKQLIENDRLMSTSDSQLDMNQEDYRVPKVGMEFETEGHAYAFYKRYAGIEGFSIRCEWVKDGGTQSLKFLCTREGFRRKRKDQCIKKVRKETKCGCMASMVISLQRNGKYRVSIFVAKHNHECSTPNANNILRSERKILPAQAAILGATVDFGTQQRAAFELAGKENGGHHHTSLYVDTSPPSMASPSPNQTILPSPAPRFYGDSFSANMFVTPKYPILEVSEAYNKNCSPTKLNLDTGASRIEEGKSLVLNVARQAEQQIVNDRLIDLSVVARSMATPDSQCEYQTEEERLLQCQLDFDREECKTPCQLDMNQEGSGVPKVGMEFEIEDHAYAFYKKYAGMEGFSVRREWVNRNKNGVTQSRKYVCTREGFRRKRKDQIIKKFRKETKCGCMAAMIISLQRNGKYRVSAFVAEHNHDCSTPNANNVLKSKRKIPTIQDAILDGVKDSGNQPGDAFEFTGKESGVHYLHTSSSSDTYPTCMASKNCDQAPFPVAWRYVDSVFASVVEAPKDPHLGVAVAYGKDPNPSKLNLGVGADRTEKEMPLVLRQSEQLLVNDWSMDTPDNQCKNDMEEGGLVLRQLNRDQEDCNTPPRLDLDQEGYWVPKVGMEFENEDYAYAFYQRYAGREGFRIRREWINRKKNGVIQSRKFVCTREGFRRKYEDKKGTMQHCAECARKTRKETKCGCMAAMMISLQKNDKYQVKVFVARHNHECSTPSENLMLKPQRKTTPTQAAILDIADDSGTQPRAVFEIMSKDNGDHNNHSSSSADTSSSSVASQDPKPVISPSMAAGDYSDSAFINLVEVPNDSLLGVTVAYKKDPRPSKSNLGLDSYQTEEEKLLVLNEVAQAEQLIVNDWLMDTPDSLSQNHTEEGNQLPFCLDYDQEECKTQCRLDEIQEGCGVPEVGMEFETEDHAYVFYNRYARTEGFRIRREWINKNKNGVTQSRKFVCSREGFRRKRKHKDEKGTSHYCAECASKIRKVTKCGCMAAMVISLQCNGKYRVNTFVDKHNHDCSTPREKGMLKSDWKIPPTQAALLDASNDAEFQPGTAFELMRKERGCHNHHTFLSDNTSTPCVPSLNSNQAISPSPVSRCYGASILTNVVEAPNDLLLGFVSIKKVTVGYEKDPSPTQLNMGVGAYRTKEGKPLVLNGMRQNTIARQTKQLIINDCPAIHEKRLATARCLLGSLSIGSECLERQYQQRTLYIPQPTLRNQPKFFTSVGLFIKTCCCYYSATRGLYLQGLLENHAAALTGAIVPLHTRAYGPCSVDPNLDQWEQITQLMRANGLIPFFDSAYQDFTSGGFDVDAKSLGMLVADGDGRLAAQNFAKNMSLYGERVGVRRILCKIEDVADRVEGQLKVVSRPMHSSPLIHGESIASTTLKDRKAEVFEPHDQEDQNPLQDLILNKLLS